MIGRHRFALTLGILILLGLIASSTPLLAFTRDIWPTYLHDGRHSGRSPYVGPNGPFFRWTYPGSDASSVTIATDGTLRFCSENSNAYALNPDGTFRWSYGSSSQIWSTPAIATDGSILFECDGGKFYRVDSGGSLIWSWDGGDGNMAMSPVIADDLNMVFFLYSVSSLGNGVLRSLYMSGPNQGTVAWTQSFGGNMEFDKTSPAFDGDTVYVTGTEAVDGLSGVLVALEASTGTVKWTYPPSGTIDGVTYSSPSVSEDREFIYFGDDGDDHNEAVLYCVASDGTLAWAWDSPEAGAGVLNAPAIGTDGTLYVVDTEANLFAIASDGTLKWSVELAAGTHLEYANAIIDAAGTIYVTANGGLFFGVSPFGQRCWAYDLGYGATTWLSPGSIGTAGTLYFSSRTRDTVYAVHTGSYLTNPAYTPDCGSSATIFEFTVDCSLPPTVATLRTVQVHLDDGTTVVDLHFDSGVTWIGTVSSLAAGPYQYYLSYETWGGITGTYPDTGWLDGPSVDNTAPTSQCWCDYQCATNSVIEVGFTSSDDLTEVTRVSLWYRRTPDCEGQKWWGDWTYLMSTDSTVGVFSVPWSLEGRTQFLTIAEDCANTEAKSTADCWIIYDDTAPVTHVTTRSSFWGGPGYAAPIRVDYDVDESCTYEPDVELWYRYDGGSWTYDQKEEGSGRQGYFNFWPTLDGEYTFGCVSTDNCGNDEGTPSTTRAVIYDTTNPTSIVTDAPTYDPDGTFQVDVAATDPSISANKSGVMYVWLYYQYNGGPWYYYTGAYQGCVEHTTDSFNFVAPFGDGVYGFHTVARDCCGNTEPYPTASTPPDMETIVDTTPPRSRAIAPDIASGPGGLLVSYLIHIDYVAYDETSGVDYVKLYWNLDGGAWHLYTGTGNTQAGETGTFPFAVPAPGSNGVYGFYTVAYDKAGLHEALPVDAVTPPDSSTAYDDIAPLSWPLTCTDASQGTLLVSGAATDNLTGIASVLMFYRKVGGAYDLYEDPPILTYWTEAPGDLAFTYSFLPGAGDGEYEFYFIAEDMAGNLEGAPSGTITGFWDTTPPESSCWAAGHYLNTTTVTLDYLATDSTMTVGELWLYYRFGDDDGFNVTGSTLGGGTPVVSGNVDFEMQHGEGTYYFYTLAKDELGNWEVPPENADWWVMLDTTAPTSHCISPEYATVSPIAVDFASEDMPSSGVEETQLWYRFNGGAWTDSGLAETGNFGTFYFTPGDGDGTYDFCTRALDKAGNLSGIPAEPHTTTIYDTTAPYSVSGCHSPVDYAPVEILYSAADDTSGLAKVCLWHRYSSDGGTTWTPDWTFTGMVKTDAIGAFYYDPTFGDGWYEFYVVAEDNAGIWESKSTRDTYCGYTGTTPTSKANAQSYASDGTIQFNPTGAGVPGIEVGYSAYTPGSEVSDVTLWYRYEGGEWNEYDGDYGYTAPTGSILFPWAAPHNEEGLYEFFTILEDTDGNVELAPPVPDTWCIHDITPPWSFVESVDEVSASTIYLDYVADDTRKDGITPSGLYSVSLWYSYEGGNWTLYDTIENAPTAGTIIFDHPAASDGTIIFYTIATDKAGNQEGIPAGPDDTTVYDGTAPVSAADPISPYYTHSPNITIGFTATDNYSGVAYVDLWYRYAEAHSPWGYSGLRHMNPATGAGSFNFVATEGTIEFYTIATDEFGNIESPPSAADTSVCYDVTPPVSEIISTEGTVFYNYAPIPIYYSASDAVSGISVVSLYYRFNGGFWMPSGLTETATDGEFLFTPPAGAGTYEFYTIAQDGAGNTESPPTGDFYTVLYDLTKPTSQATGPLYTAVPDIDVTYTASDDLSGIALVGLMYRFGDGGWAPWLDDYGDSTSGTIALTLPYGEGTYYIFTQSVDNAGNVEDWKSTHDIVTIYDTQEPDSSCFCAEYSTSSPIPVRYGAVDPDSSGIAEVCLQYNWEGTGWQDSGLCDTSASGTFNFVPSEGPGTYQFRTLATDNSGNEETPGAADCETYYDNVAPTSECTCATLTTTSRVDIDFNANDATGTLDRVALWVRYSPDYGTTWTIGWQESGLYSEDASGTFRFDPSFGGGRYEFYTVASDMAGNYEATPSTCDCWTAYDGSKPSSFATSPAVWNGTNIPVSYTATVPSGATLDTVTLWWRRYVGPDYTSWHKYTDEYGTETVGTIYFTYPLGNSLYEFFTVAKQTDATTETLPWPWLKDCACQVDTGDPISSCTSDAYVEDVPIIVNFTAADGVTDVADVALWFNFNGGSYSEYAEHRSGTAGYFVFDPPFGQGTYGFYTIATDEAGNVEAPPGSPPDSQTTWDISKPSSDCVGGAPALVTGGTITVGFTSSDPVGNGVVRVSLWFNVDGGVWHHSGLEVTDTNIHSGSFDFTPCDGDGLYGFFTVAEDNWGNVEDPALAPDDTTLVDGTAPSSFAIYSGPTYSTANQFTIGFTASDGDGNVSGVSHTALWYRFNGGAWTDTGLTQAGESGTFMFTASDGDGMYEFYTIATDVAGNVETAPGSADCYFYRDTQLPESSASSPFCSITTATISVDYTSSDYGPAGVSGVELFYRYNGGPWTYWGTAGTASGTFGFVPSLEGTYDFATRAWDKAGNWETFPPAAPDTTTFYDVTAPASTCSAPACAVNRSIPVSFTASDNVSGVASTSLWVRLDGASWQDTGLTLPGTSGQFVYDDLVGTGFEGIVEFYTVSVDNCGNSEDAPDLYHDAITIVDFTPPESSCTAPSTSTDQHVEIAWVATDATAGVDYTELWFSDNSERYEKFGEYFGTSGTIDFVMSSEGIYHFYTISVDLCGNREARPAVADAVTTFDTLGPTSTVEAPAYANSLPIVVRFTASDDTSGVASTSLFYCFNGLCAQYGEPVSGTSGEFLFTPDPAVEGTYEFYTISTDNMGNTEAMVLSPEVSTVYDKTAPSSSCSSPGIATSAPFDVPYTALDNGPAGLDRVALWFKLGSGTWQEYTGDYGTSPLGVISFNPPGGLEGTYSLYTIATDKAGNVEASPGAIDATAVYDQTPPESTASVAEFSNSAPISVSFTTVETASGIANVALWAKFGETGVWENTGLSSPDASGTFNYSPLAGEGRYFFYTIATDNAGFVEAAPAAADASTLFDSTAPVTQLEAPAGVSTLPITLTFTCGEPTIFSGAPIETVVLFYRFNLGPWLSTGLSANTDSGTFNFTPTEGPGSYDFYSIGIDKAGNRELAAGKELTTVAYDIASPTSSCSCENTYRQLPLAISYTADGTGSDVASVELFYNYEGMGWLSTGLSMPGETGVLLFVPAEGDGRYDFYTLATDAAGNTETWDGHADCTCFLDTVAPETVASAPEWTTSSPIVVHFEGSDQGIGVAVVELWSQYESYQWQKVDEKAAATSGDFIFTPGVEGGLYKFYTIGRDLAGNVEAAPATPDASTAFDTSAPMSAANVPQYATSAVIGVNYAALDAYSGVDSIRLWCRYNRGAWFDTGYVLPGTSGTIAVTLTHGHGKYDFYTIAVDKAGNEESPPAVPDGSCFYDATRPTSSCSCARYTTELPLNVRFTADDADTQIASVVLMYRFNGGDWTSGGMMVSRSWGVFEFGAPEGEGYYEFYTLATNNAGWQELPPSTPDAFSYYDITLPSSSVSSPDKMTGDTIPVTFSAWDSLSGVRQVELWYRYEDRLWAKSGYQMEATSGTVDFIPPDGVGTYSFWTVASDNCGNTEPAPTTAATVTAVTVFDNVPPQSSVSVEDQWTSESPVPVAFTASDKGVGVASVRLWYSVGGSAFKDTGLEVTGATIGVFDFVPVEGDGAYEFYSIAEDGFGNREAPPSEADASVVFDTTAPFSTASSPDEVHATEVTVGFSATDVLSPIVSVRLWYRYAASLSGSWSDWADSGLTAQGEAGLFPFEATHGEGFYEFYTIATDAAGNVEEPPASADSRTQYRLRYPEISLSDYSHDFGEVQVGMSAFWPELYVSNTGEAPLTIESISIDNLAFGCSVLTPISIEPSMGVFLPVFFTPSYIGLTEGTMTITSNDPANPEVQVSLSGTGIGSSPMMSLEIGSNGSTFYPGDTLSISLSCHNGETALLGVDLYVSLILPNGVVVYLPSFGTEPEPYVSDFDVMSGFQLQGFELLRAVVPEGLAPGEYVWRAYVAPHGRGTEMVASLPLVTAIDLRPEVGLSLDGANRTYGVGQGHVLSARFRNDGLPKTLDLYVALRMPDGSLLFAPGLSFAPTACLDNYELPMHADVSPVKLFRGKLNSFPAGKYTWFAVFSDANSFSPISRVAHIEWELE